jgi:hypothetical protein
MSMLPTGFAQLTLAFAPLVFKRVFQSIQVLLFGAILAIGKCTVASVLRVMGLDQQAHVSNVSSGIEPCPMVTSCRRSHFIEPAGTRFHATWAVDLQPR